MSLLWSVEMSYLLPTRGIRIGIWTASAQGGMCYRSGAVALWNRGLAWHVMQGLEDHGNNRFTVKPRVLIRRAA
jgi:hypothetical protein